MNHNQTQNMDSWRSGQTAVNHTAISRTLTYARRTNAQVTDAELLIEETRRQIANQSSRTGFRRTGF